MVRLKIVGTEKLIADAYCDAKEAHKSQKPKNTGNKPKNKQVVIIENKHLQQAFTRKMASAIGLNYPLKKGWKKRLLGIEITKKQESAFIKAQSSHKKYKSLPKNEQKEVRRNKHNIRKAFYTSSAWRSMRYNVLVAYGRKCMCCGASPSDGIVLHVDHIKPRSDRPDLELEFNNLQVLCEDCNLGKSNTDETDFR